MDDRCSFRWELLNMNIDRPVYSFGAPDINVLAFYHSERKTIYGLPFENATSPTP